MIEVLDRLLADGFRVFATEVNYYCPDALCANDNIEFALIKVSQTGHVCLPHPKEYKGEMSWPKGCFIGNSATD